MSNSPKVINNALLADGRIVQIRIEEGRYTSINLMSDVASHDPSTDESLDLRGNLMMPALVDGHLHLDKTLMGLPWLPHDAAPDRESRMENDRRILPLLPLSVGQRASNLINKCVTYGTGHMRSHVDVNTDRQLDSLHQLLAVRESHKELVDIELVAFPGTGVARNPGTLDLLDQAIQDGADLIGGMDPCVVDRDPAYQLNGIFALAEKHGVGLDIHLHELGELGIFSLEEICKRTQTLGLQGKVTISHGFCLGTVNESTMRGAVSLMAKSGVGLATHGAAKWPLPPIALLRSQGVLVIAGNDDIRDTWSPYGTGDVLARAALIGWRADYRKDEDVLNALDLVTFSGAKALSIKNYGISEGNPADFFTVDAENAQEALACHPVRKLVVKGGTVIAREGARVFS